MSNRAAWIASKGARLHIDGAPYPKLQAGRVIVRNHAVAINPIDWKIQEFGFFVQNWPTIVGCDLAGEVVEVGEGVTNVHKGQRVLGHAQLLSGEIGYSAFQLYSSVPSQIVSPIPNDMSFEDATVVPLGISTAALSLYEKHLLALPYPSTTPNPGNSTLIVWGGSSSVGSAAIQLAVASGLKVFSTASKHNFAYVKSIGAEAVFDYHDAHIVDELIRALKGSKLAGGLDAIGELDSITPLVEVVSKLGGGIIIDVLPPPEHVPAGVEVKNVWAAAIEQSPVGKAIYIDYLPQALKDGRFKPLPKAKVVGHGLESLQGGLDELKKGVSATKLVVSLA